MAFVDGMAPVSYCLLCVCVYVCVCVCLLVLVVLLLLAAEEAGKNM